MSWRGMKDGCLHPHPHQSSYSWPVLPPLSLVMSPLETEDLSARSQCKTWRSARLPSTIIIGKTCWCAGCPSPGGGLHHYLSQLLGLMQVKPPLGGSWWWLKNRSAEPRPRMTQSLTFGASITYHIFYDSNCPWGSWRWLSWWVSNHHYV